MQGVAKGSNVGAGRPARERRGLGTGGGRVEEQLDSGQLLGDLSTEQM